MIKTWTKNLRQTIEECRKPDWDGYDAEPVIECVIESAEKFLNSLPDDIPEPDFGADPDGDITLEWTNTKLESVGISIAKEGWNFVYNSKPWDRCKSWASDGSEKAMQDAIKYIRGLF